jgi:hypothetical protein
MAHRRRRVLGSTAVLVAVLVAFVLTLPITLTPGLRTRLTAALGERFDSAVQLETLRVSVLPRIRVSGTGLALQHKGRTDVPPLIEIASFSAEASLFGLIGRPIRLQRIDLDGLEINVPPGGMSVNRDDEARDMPASSEASGPGHDPAASAGAVPPADVESRTDRRSPIIVDRLLTERAVLRILRGDPEKEPRVFEIHRLSMDDAGSHEPWAFSATLTNPTPPGEIDAHGTFGPWNAPEPARTSVNGAYEFSDADLSVFEGIQGTLQSTGGFGGVLERIVVEGEADVPDFALSDVGQPVPLHTRFTSIVDATSGNTWLEPVEATLDGSRILADGGVVERDGEKGRTVTLDVVLDDARIEDVLRLAVKSKQVPMTGALKLTTAFVLPPGPGDAVQKMRLNGSFQIARARFTTGNVQARINELSQKARVDDEDEGEPEQVVSDLKGRFVMSGGTIRFSNVSFSVPGARVDVSGTYAIKGEALDFQGTVRLDARLSQMTTGVRSALLRLIDPLVRRKDATVIPVTIKGTVDDPKFGLDIRRTITRG